MSRDKETPSERHTRKMTYEKERREKISVLFKDLNTALVEAGIAPEEVETQLESLATAIEIIRGLRKEGVLEPTPEAGTVELEAKGQDVVPAPIVRPFPPLIIKHSFLYIFLLFPFGFS